MRLWKSFRVQRRNEISYYDTMGEFEAERFAVNLNQLIAEAMAEKQKAGVIFLCIGTDRSTGDSLGPLVGHKLRKCRLKKAAVIGTLDKPVHAMNLEVYAAYIRTHFPDHVIVAIDASVGSPDHVGFATLGKGALQPGLGVSKELMEVGDISITGIVGGPGSGDVTKCASFHGNENGRLHLRKHYPCRTILGKYSHNMTKFLHSFCYS